MPPANVKVRLSAQDETTEIINRVERELKKLDAGARRTAGGMKQLQGSTVNMGSTMRTAAASMQSTLKTMGAAAAAMAAFKLAGAAKDILNTADALGKLSQKTGAPVEGLSVLQHGANLAGVSAEGLESGLKRLSKTLQDVKRGTGEGAAAFRALGLSAADFDGLDLTQSMVLLADKFAAFEDSPAKAAAAMAIFGRAGADLLPLFADLANGGFARLNDEADRLGVKMSKEAVAAATKFNDALSRLGGAASGVLIALTPVVGVIADMARFMAEVVGWMRKLIATSPRATAIGEAVLSPFKLLGDVLEQLRASQAEIAAGAEGNLANWAQLIIGKSLGGKKGQLNFGAAGRNAAQQLQEVQRRMTAEIAAQKAFNQLALDLEQDRYKQGLISAETFYTRRREIAEEESAKELAALDAERTGLGRRATSEQLAGFEARRQTIETAREREILTIERERLATIQQLSTTALDFGGQAAAAKGDTLTHAIAKAKLAAEEYHRILEQLGTKQPVIEGITTEFARALTLRAQITDEQRKAAQVMAELAAERDRVQGEADRGLISQSEAERRILELERSRKTELTAIARQAVEFAEALGNPELITAAKALAGEVERMGVSTDAAGKALTNLKDSIGAALVGDLSNFFSSTITQAENLGQAFMMLANDIVSSIARIMAQILAMKLVEAIGLPVPGFARGGYVSGPGGPTSDSITARLSAGEYVVRAAAVKRYGVEFLDMLNMARGGLRTPRLQRFGIPAFAAGGLVEGGAAAGSGTPAHGRMEALVGLEPGLVVSHLRSTEGMRTIVEAIGHNPRAVRAVLGLA